MALIVVIQNISALAPVSDYRWEVLVGDGSALGSRSIARGEVQGHARADGWQVLVEKVLAADRAASAGGDL